MNATHENLLPRINEALDKVVDPCSVGRSVPAGLVDMGMVSSVSVVDGDGGPRANVTLRLTSPGCHFQHWFTERVTDEIARVSGIEGVDISWSTDFDWTDDDMSTSLKARLRAKRPSRDRSQKAP